MIAKDDMNALIRGEGNVLSSDGEKIGGIGRFYLDGDTGEPGWLTVKTGLFGLRESFVPLEGAWIQGVDLVIPYTKEEVKDAPLIDPDAHPGPEEEARLDEHYRPGERTRTYADAVEEDAADEGGPFEGERRPLEPDLDTRSRRLRPYTGTGRNGGDESLDNELRTENRDSEGGV
jgi:hypothetical protein